VLFEREQHMLDAFLDLIQDADALSGWNSEGYDIPYTVNRVTRVLSRDDSRRFCLWDQYPKKRIFERFGAENETYDLVGRVHMDYMQLYRKYTYEERHSYSLDAIGEYELNECKTAFEGTLDQLYNQNFRTFIEYNRQDTMLLAKLDQKLRFLDLANELAHANTVLLQTTMGAVAVTEQAIINEAHERGMVVPNRKQRLTDDDTQAAGAYVAVPKKGIHEWVGSVDINSLYPSAIRALNMGPETIVGQLRPIMTDRLIADRMRSGASFAAAWEGLFGSLEYTAVMEQQRGTEITIDWSSGNESVHSAAEIWRMIFDSNQPWMLTANGTIVTYEVKGVVAGLLERWYSERKDLQARKKQAQNKKEETFWDKRQLVKKINLNSLYGAILNPGCRFFDHRIGQSTTLTGRAIARHMNAYINECITGQYDHQGAAIIYGDSVTGDTKIRTDDGETTIEELFTQCLDHSIIGTKEYGTQCFAKVVGFNSFEDHPVMSEISYVMRHKTKKKIFKIVLENGKEIKVTQDHSVMVDRDGFLIEVKPTEILPTDLIICLQT
jgi:DNA polymerase elongation subunit (family B)